MSAEKCDAIAKKHSMKRVPNEGPGSLAIWVSEALDKRDQPRDLDKEPIAGYHLSCTVNDNGSTHNCHITLRSPEDELQRRKNEEAKKIGKNTEETQILKTKQCKHVYTSKTIEFSQEQRRADDVMSDIRSACITHDACKTDEAACLRYGERSLTLFVACGGVTGLAPQEPGTTLKEARAKLKKVEDDREQKKDDLSKARTKAKDTTNKALVAHRSPEEEKEKRISRESSVFHMSWSDDER